MLLLYDSQSNPTTIKIITKQKINKMFRSDFFDMK